jgi:hypothetical protein
VQPESKLDDVGDVRVVDVLADLVFEGVEGAAGGGEPRLEVLGADDAMARGGIVQSFAASASATSGESRR